MAIALYRRYRPESFAEVIGQDHVTTPLRRALRAGRVGHAYLFSGPRGCGKTTSARILARCLNCAEGPTDTPCGTCDSCRDLARGGAGSLDVVEIDAASHGGVDDARELRERASFAPVRDRFKVFIIDEAHMVTSAGFNALLKLVEEPPEHVKFVFATTEPDKVIGTIRSRTHHYPFRLIPPQVLGPYLEEVSAAEGITVGAGVMPLVVRAGGGSARDSMSVLDQLMAGAGDDGLDFPTAIALLGFTDTALLDTAITAVAERDAAALYGAVEQVLATGHEPRRFVEDLLERMRDLIVLAAVPDKGGDLLPQVPADELERMRGQAALFAPADLSQCGDLVHETLSTMSGATSPRLHLELLAARLVLRDERAALAAAADGNALGAQGVDGAASAGQRPAGGPGPEPAAGGSGAREEARRIAQQRAEAARQARGGRAPVQPGTPQASAADPRSRPEPQAEPFRPAAPPEPAVPQQASVSQQASVPPRASAPQQASAPSAASAPQQPASPPATAPQHAPEPAAPARETVAAEVPSAGSAAPAPTGTGGLDVEQVRGHWSAILDELQQIRRPSWALISQNAHVHQVRGATVVLGFRTDGLVAAFRRGTAAENLADAVQRILHTPVTIDAVVGEDPGPGSGGGPGGSGGDGGPGGSGGDGGPGGPRGPGSSRGAGGAGGSGPSTGSGPHGSSEQPPSRAPQRPGAGSDPAAAQPSSSSGGTGGDTAPVAPARWGEPAAAKPDRSAVPRTPGPEAQGQPAMSAGQRAAERAMQASARAAQGRPGGQTADRFDDFPPEPDDPYPPDPEDYAPPTAAPGRAAAGTAARSAAAAPAPQGSGRWSDATTPAAQAPAQPSRAASEGSAGANAPGAATTVPPAVSGEIPVVEDAGRDNLPPGEPRTYGQNALKRAIAEGRVVRSRPAAGATVPAASAAPAADPSAPASGPSAPSSDGASSADGASGSGLAPAVGNAGPAAQPASTASRSAAAASSTTSASPSASETPSGGANPSGSAAERAAASWGTAASISTAAAAPAPVAPTGAGPSAAPARSGAALAREAAQASRTGGLRSRGVRGEVSAASAADADPTGGATRDDEDAVAVTRNGREVIEKMLGGKVLEVIDETGQGR
ncbi:DNA polymerase III subunit gamma and tau [Brachybacterium sp. UNK5269]|uniref:DNA polymerase III subunit gamma and tau n=1 Tax=Brachybacterium sp. UNK5269 TaxID=3408576 RepID=UPI003BB08BEC